MRYPLYLLFIFIGTTSCQFFTTEKIPSETFYEEELQAINWNDIDLYPVFSDCERLVEKLAQKECFENTLTIKMHQSISAHQIVPGREIVDTLFLTMQISKEGDLSVRKLEIDSVLQTDFPELESWLLDSIDSLKIMAPAYKRGIPVKTEFTLPVVIQSD